MNPLAILAAISLALGPGPTPAAERLNVNVTTIGGDTVVGILVLKPFPIKTELGELRVDPKTLKSIRFGSKEGRDSIQTFGGSQIRGTIDLQELTIESELGMLTLPRSKIETIAVEYGCPSKDAEPPPTGDAKPEAPRDDKPEAAPTKPEKPSAGPEERASRPRPIPSYLLHPSSTKVVKIRAAVPPKPSMVRYSVKSR